MGFFVKIALVMLVVATFASSSTAQAPAEGAQDKSLLPQWVQCDYATVPGESCADCSTRLICTRLGGLLKTCLNPFRPHCNNGLCTATPSAACAAVEEPATTVAPE